MGRVTIEVLNFRKFNPRIDRKKHTWFRLENTIASDPQFAHLTGEQMWAWIAILSYAAQKASADETPDAASVQFTLTEQALAKHLRLPAERVDETLNELSGLECIRVTRSAFQGAPAGNQSVTAPTPAGNQAGAARGPVVTDGEPPGNQSVAGGDRSGATGITTDGRTDAHGRTNEKTAATTSDARARDGDIGIGEQPPPPEEPIGPIEELADVVGAEVMLAAVKQSVQRNVWIRVFTLAVVRAELSLAYSKWVIDDARRAQGNVQLYLNSWFQNELKAMTARGNGTRESPGQSQKKPKELVWVRFEDMIPRKPESDDPPFISLTRQEHERWTADFKAGRGGMPPPIAGRGPTPPSAVGGNASVIPIGKSGRVGA